MRTREGELLQVAIVVIAAAAAAAAAVVVNHDFRITLLFSVNMLRAHLPLPLFFNYSFSFPITLLQLVAELRGAPAAAV
jgi:hypothetical protein